MSMLEKARALESRIARALSQAAVNAVGPSAREPLEIVHAIVETVEREIQSGGRGVRVFPFNSVAITVLAPSRDARARLEAAFTGSPDAARAHRRAIAIGQLRRGRSSASMCAYAGRSAAGWRASAVQRGIRYAWRRQLPPRRRRSRQYPVSRSPWCAARPSGAPIRSPRRASTLAAAARSATAATGCSGPTTLCSSTARRARTRPYHGVTRTSRAISQAAIACTTMAVSMGPGSSGAADRFRFRRARAAFGCDPGTRSFSAKRACACESTHLDSRRTYLHGLPTATGAGGDTRFRKTS